MLKKSLNKQKLNMKLNLLIICGVYLCGIFYFDVIRNVQAEFVRNVELTSFWNLTNQNQTITKTGLKVPTGVYSALYNEEVLNSYNDVEMRWIAHDNWTFTRRFVVDPKDREIECFVNLTFHGIDTIAEIRLNHYLVGRTDNMFVRYSYEVSRYLEVDNLLEIEIKSPIYAALVKANALKAAGKPVPPYCPPLRYHGECHMNMLRKMQASFAWDWGLAAPSMGIWKSVALEWYKVALLRDIDIVTSKNETHWLMNVRVYIDAAGGKDFYAKLTFYPVELLENSVVIKDYKRQKISYKSPIIEFQQAFPIEVVRPWWPNGYGEQKLYPFHFTLNAWIDDKGANLLAKTVSQKSLYVGFRTIELVEEPAGHGNTFLFKVNGEEIFMKGSNYIPAHILPEFGGDEGRIRHLLQSARDANMNMLRIWGGGVYESDYFYNLADQYGILIWQDMMFACAMYPADESFLESVSTEVIQNARRLSHHPSVAIFATNNENEVALAQNWYHTFHEKERFEKEYRELYLGTVMHQLKVVDHSSRPRPLVSSPSNGKESEKDNYLSPDPQDPNYGDMHFYDYMLDAWDPSIFPRPRFVSEYGFQSLPQMKAWQSSKKESDDLLALIDHRQHHPAQNFPIIDLVRRHLPLPLPEDENYAEALIYFSQISQAMATKIETELYRSLRDTEHRTMGALYWQLNDVWVAPSWSSIDFYGNFKILHHWAKDFLAPVAIFALYDKRTQSINVTLACDNLRVNTADLQVTQNIYGWSDLFWKESKAWPVTLKPNGVQYDKVIPIKDIFQNGYTKRNSFVEFTLQRGTVIISRTYFFPAPIKSAEGLLDAGLNFDMPTKYCNQYNDGKINNYSLSITVKRPAIFVFIEVIHKDVKSYKLSRNGFIQKIPVQIVHLEFESKECIELDKSHIKILTVNQFMKQSTSERSHPFLHAYNI